MVIEKGKLLISSRMGRFGFLNAVFNSRILLPFALGLTERLEPSPVKLRRMF